ncbi:hypothetical protein Tco_0320624 [Tanacetum coccineum]
MEYSSEDYHEEIEAEPRPPSNGQARPALRIGITSERRGEVSNGRTGNGGNVEVNLPPLLAAHLGRTEAGAPLDICPSSYILIFLVLRVYMLLGFRSAVSPKGLSLRMCSLFSYGYPILIVVPFVYKVCRNCEFGLAILSEGEGDSLNFFIGDLPPLLPHKMRTMDN